jgi:hypothetical protein
MAHVERQGFRARRAPFSERRQRRAVQIIQARQIRGDAAAAAAALGSALRECSEGSRELLNRSGVGTDDRAPRCALVATGDREPELRLEELECAGGQLRRTLRFQM